MRSLFLASAGLGLFALVVACSPRGADDVATGNEQHLDEVKPIAPAVWATCWFTSNGSSDPFFLAYTMTCSGPADASYPLPVTVILSGSDKQNGQPVNGQLDAGKTKDVGTVFAQRLPLALELEAVIDPTQRPGVVSTINPGDFRLTRSIDHPETITAAAPLVVTQPFALWPITVLQKTSRYVLVPGALSALPAAPFVVGFTDGKTFDVQNSLVQSAADASPIRFLAVAPPNGQLGVRYFTTAEKDTALDAPGTYVAENDRIRHATDADVAGAPASPPAAPTTPPAPPSPPDAGPAPSGTDAGPPPTCGVADLVCCNGDSRSGGTCGAGTYCKYNPNGADTCIACGGAGQACCNGDSRSGGTCGGGTYCKYNPNGADSCTSCGGAGQDCCGGNKGTCGAGLSCTYNPNGTDVCH